MIDIKRGIIDRRRFVLQVGENFWHISYKEARHLLNKLKELKVDRRIKND